MSIVADAPPPKNDSPKLSPILINFSGALGASADNPPVKAPKKALVPIFTYDVFDNVLII